MANTLPVVFANLPPGLNPMALFDQQFAAVQSGVENGANLTDGSVPDSKLVDSGVVAGAYTKLTVNGKGIATGGAQASAADLSNGVTGSGEIALATSPALVGNPTAPTAATGTNTTQLATTAFVQASFTAGTGIQLSGTAFSIANDANLPGVPTAATASPGTNTSQIATTAFVMANAGAAPYVATPALLASINTSAQTIAYTMAAGQEGFWQWNGANVSSTVAPRAIVSSAVNTSTGTITSNGYRLKTGDAVLSLFGGDGLAANTYYYIVVVDANNFKLAASRANALSGTTVTLTGSTTITLQVTPDDLQGEVVFKTGALKDGSQGAWLRILAVAGEHILSNFGLINAADNSGAFNVAGAVACEAGGGAVILPASDIYMTGMLWARRNVVFRGVAREKTRLSFYGVGPAYAFNAIDPGTDGSYPNDRTITGLESLTLWGWTLDASSATRGIGIQNALRAWPMTNQVIIAGFPNDGIFFAGETYNTGFAWTQVQTCGRLRSNASGIRFDPSCIAMADLAFDHCLIEGCGNSSSTAGGFCAPLSTANGDRNWSFIACEFEGSFGTDEVYIQNVGALQFVGMYYEGASGGAPTAFELNNCTGGFDGASLSPDAVTTQTGIKLSGTSSFSLKDMIFTANFGTIDVTVGDTSKAWALNLPSFTHSVTGSGVITIL